MAYTAPATVPAGGACRVRATSVAHQEAWAEATVTVVEAGVAPAVTSVVINEGPQELVVRGSAPLSVTVEAVGGASEVVVWSSDRERVVTVDGDGVVVGVAQGRTTVTARSVFAPDVHGSVTVDVVADFEHAPSYITLENVSVGAANAATLIPANEGTRQVSFDVRWPDSWRNPSRPTWVAAEDNWDAAWVFLKYRVDGGAWRHATLAGSGHVAPSGAVVDVPGDGVGASSTVAVVGMGRLRPLVWGCSGITRSLGYRRMRAWRWCRSRSRWCTCRRGRSRPVRGGRVRVSSVPVGPRTRRSGLRSSRQSGCGMGRMG